MHAHARHLALRLNQKGPIFKISSCLAGMRQALLKQPNFSSINRPHRLGSSWLMDVTMRSLRSSTHFKLFKPITLNLHIAIRALQKVGVRAR